jgi:phage terminase large subunit GpA-like protein
MSEDKLTRKRILKRILGDVYNPVVMQSIVKYIESTIDMTDDDTCAIDGLIKLEPYQIEPVQAWDYPHVTKLTNMAVEQTGKSLVWKLPLLGKIVMDPGPVLTVYESDEKAVDTNVDTIEPLCRLIPPLAAALKRPYCKTQDSYKFPKAPWYFMGAGAEITSKAARYAVADEIEEWKQANDSNVHNIKKLDNRLRTYDIPTEGQQARHKLYS